MNLGSIKQRISDQVAAARERWPVLDHVLRTLSHYGEVLGTQLAAAVTYFGFLSFFPIIALAFAAVGYVVDYVPDAEQAVTEAMKSIFPGLIGTGSGQINVHAIASKKADVGVIGLVGLLYSGLGWVSALRKSLRGVFREAGAEKRNFVLGKLIDLVALGIIGVVLVASVALGTAIVGFAHDLIGAVGLSDVPGTTVLLRLAGVVVGLAANTVLFFIIYKLLPKQDDVPTRSVWQGAFIAAVGFEVLKQLAGTVIGSVTSNPLYGTFAVMIALLVWINYFSRLVVLGACWAATARTQAEVEVVPEEPPGMASRVVRGLVGVTAVAVLAFKRGGPPQVSARTRHPRSGKAAPRSS